MRLLRRSTSPEAFAAAMRVPATRIGFDFGQSELGRRYYEITHGHEREEVSFALVDGDAVICLAMSDILGGTLGWFGAPLRLRFPDPAQAKTRRIAVRHAISEWEKIAADRSATRIAVLVEGDEDPDGISACELCAWGAAPVVAMRAEIDLTWSPSDILDDMRPSHRRHLRWGETNLALSALGPADGHDAFDAIRIFHAEVAGRVTRSEASWQVAFDAVRAGRGSLVIGRLDGTLVAATLVLDGLATGWYATGIYHRGYFDKPLGHIGMYRSMLAAQERGLSWFDVGEVFAANDTVDDKLRSIGHYKRGFAARTRSAIRYQRDFAAV